MTSTLLLILSSILIIKMYSFASHRVYGIKRFCSRVRFASFHGRTPVCKVKRPNPSFFHIGATPGPHTVYEPLAADLRLHPRPSRLRGTNRKADTENAPYVRPIGRQALRIYPTSDQYEGRHRDYTLCATNRKPMRIYSSTILPHHTHTSLRTWLNLLCISLSLRSTAGIGYRLSLF
jgi:hypothetical protein